MFIFTDMLTNVAPFFIAALIIVPLIAIGFKLLAIKFEKALKKKFEHVDYNYKSRNFIFTPAEKNFLIVLKSAVSNNYHIYGKIRLADLIEPDFDKKRNDQKWWKTFNAISQRHVDFVVADENHNFICAVELNDISHKEKDRIKSDKIKTLAFDSANMPLIFIQCSNKYSETDIKEQLTKAVLKYIN